jgi:hypothetical protein
MGISAHELSGRGTSIFRRIQPYEIIVTKPAHINGDRAWANASDPNTAFRGKSLGKQCTLNWLITQRIRYLLMSTQAPLLANPTHFLTGHMGPTLRRLASVLTYRLELPMYFAKLSCILSSA